MASIFRAAATADLALALCRECPLLGVTLPMGGSHLAQLGLLFAVAYIIFEAAETIARWLD
jgi:hypothetical protein